MAYKYLTSARINSAIKKHGLKLAYTKGDGYFYFLDLQTNDKVGESVMVDKMHHLTIDQWRNEAAHAAATRIAPQTNDILKAVDEALRVA